MSAKALARTRIWRPLAIPPPPPLGCGNGGLDWDDVSPLIKGAFAELPNIDVRLFAPAESEPVRQLAAPEVAPRMTPGRAAVIAVLSAYRQLSYPLRRIEVQKLAYFLERAGEPLGLSFVRHIYGPYSNALRHVLTHMDGTYISGVGDQSGRSEIRVLPVALNAARSFLSEGSETLKRVERVADTIAGFQTPYGLELLATVHWVATEDPVPANFADLAARVRGWNDRKRALMSERDIGIAAERLIEDGWLDQAFAPTVSTASAPVAPSVTSAGTPTKKGQAVSA